MMTKEWRGEPLTIDLRESDKAGDTLSGLSQRLEGYEYKIWVGIENGEQVGVGGVVKAQGKGEAFIYLSDKATIKKFAFQRVIRKKLREAVKALKIRAVNANVDLQYSSRCKWIERLGFEYTGKTLHILNKEWGVYLWVSS